MTASTTDTATKQEIMMLTQNNQLGQAKSLCMNFCNRHPGDAEAWFILGAICERLGQYPEAEKHCRKVIKLRPKHALGHYNHGIALSRLGKLDKAISSFRRATELKPDFAEAYNDLGNALAAAGRHEQATAAYRRAIKLNPGLINTHIQLGLLLQKIGQPEDSLRCYQHALQILKDSDTSQANTVDKNKAMAKLYFYVANAQFDCASFVDAEASYRKSLQLCPADAQTLNNLGNTLKALQQLPAAVEAYRNALKINPGLPEAYTNLGIALRGLRQLNEALANLEKAVQLNSTLAEGHYNLANVLQDMHRHTDAESSYLTALEIRQNFADAEMGLGNTLLSQGRATEAVVHFKNAIRMEPGHQEAHDCLLFSLNYIPEEPPGEIYRQHELWGKRTQERITETPTFHNLPHPDRKLRIGYVSPDFRSHSVAFFFKPLLASHNPDEVEVFCYAEIAYPDETTEKIKSLTSHWRTTTGKTDEEVANMIKRDEVDILIDLAGHTGNNRLNVFALKPAPVQISWLGYPNTTGLRTIDYRVTDINADPEDITDHLNTEKLIRLPSTFLCYAPISAPPDVTDTPALAAGHITFGSFNMLAKVTPHVVKHWAQILAELPGSRLILKTRALEDEGSCNRYRSLFERHGIAADRLDFVSWTPGIREHLAYYGQVDIALDTYPYNGTTTTCEALFMGVPVISLEGDSHAGRVGASLLNTIKKPELIAGTPEDYTRIARQLAREPLQLNIMRKQLRNQVTGSSLCNSLEFAINMEHAYREAWHNWCSDAV